MRTATRFFLGACLTFVVGGYALSRPLHDFLAYWTTGHLFVAQNNPYSLGQVFQVERAFGWPEPVPSMVLNPPWTLPLLAPLGYAEPYPLAWLAWVGVLAGAVALSSRLLLGVYSGGAETLSCLGSAASWSLLAFTFYPTLICIKFAQITPLMLLGVAGFLWFEKHNRPIPAGICLALTAIKPQLLYLVWLAVFARSLQTRRWRALASAAAVLAALSLIAILVDHKVLRQYWDLSTSPYPQLYPSAMGAILRRPFGSRNTFWLQFVPALAGLFWFAAHWRRHHQNWNWAERMPALVTACILSTPYAWLYDQALLAVPIAALAAHYVKKLGDVPNRVVLVYTALNVVLIFGALRPSPFWFVFAPVTAAVFLFKERKDQESPSLVAQELAW